jgi:hypothetical protein
MGMIELTAKLFMQQAKVHDFSSSRLLTIGKQGICFTIDELRIWSHQCNFMLNDSHLALAVTEKRPLSDGEFFKSLGFLTVDSMDCSEYEGASIICNLNNDAPETLHNRFDVIYDGGSTEHMFNTAKALENYNKMLKVGGLMIHSLPSTGCMDHGFYMYSPTLFYDYYRQNNWDILSFQLINLPLGNYSTWKIYEYEEPGPSLENIDFKDRWTIFFIAEKSAYSTHNNDIEQHFFKKLWQCDTGNNLETGPTTSKRVSTIRKLYRILTLRSIRKKIHKLLLKGSKSKIPFKQSKLV